jgi:II/X family phage/plasmid replication protein
VFGSDDLRSLMSDTFNRIVRVLELSPTKLDVRQVEQGDCELFMVDINYSFLLPCRSDVRAWLRAAEFKSRTRHGRPSSKGGTVYWGQGSQRWSLKAYSKGEELEARGHRLPDALSDTPIPTWADDKLRIELRLKKKELRKRGIMKIRDLPVTAIPELYRDYVTRLDMKEQVCLSTKEAMALPNRCCQHIRSGKMATIYAPYCLEQAITGTAKNF